MFGSGKNNGNHHTEINLDGTTPEKFQAFIEDVNAELPDAVCIVQGTPLMGEPYVIVQVKQTYGYYPLIIEESYSLYIGPENAWVAPSTKYEGK